MHHVKEHVGDGAVLLTGVLGEIWYNAKSTPPHRVSTVSDQLERWTLSCHGLSEARLHIGYVHAPIPFIGARSRKSIFDLTNSEAMRPWSIGGRYDRPVARRLAEDAGVPRHLFGQKKLATVVLRLPPYIPHGAPLTTEFFHFLTQERGMGYPMYVSLISKVNVMVWKAKRIAGSPKVPRWFKGSRLGKKIIKQILSLPMSGCRLNTALYAYCVNKTAQVYRQARCAHTDTPSGQRPRACGGSHAPS